MRVLWLNHRDIEHPNAGGAERTIFEVSRRLSTLGHEVRIASAGWRGAPSTAELSGVRVRRYPTYLSPHLVLPFLLRSKPTPDVVIDDLAHVLPWGTPLLSRIPGTAFFRHLHARTLPGQVGPYSAKMLTKIERSYQNVYAHWPFVTETQTSVEDLSNIGIARSHCRIIRPGVDTRLFKPGVKSETPEFVYFGGMRRYKRADHALRAFSILAQGSPGSRLLIIGEGPELPNLKSLANELSLDDSVAFLGRVSRSRLAETLASAWINIHCSTAEGWGYSILEAAASGVPSVAYRVPGLTESIADGITGRLVEEGDPVKLAQGLAEVMHDPSNFARACRGRAEAFDWNVSTQEWEDHLESILQVK
jgi:glycosyltransferase involved in cell wall biosynthesis